MGMLRGGNGCRRCQDHSKEYGCQGLHQQKEKNDAPEGATETAGGALGGKAGALDGRSWCCSAAYNGASGGSP